ncbi:aldo-keto reductase family protein, putative [Theileria annulata]|uniref:Aldo-keto reductase family protein, putative n=1 Tax=Theileria annulata TaxID=5874 RepID=Q4UFS3_THEAN|nr:aldo-keto reductase family protein, putative [Theileria annulata]CAI74043.1 aldo-keto reductase family protein, putative [Theileria annulata]|eukprot:XP_951775.1 aldo-keto reductase family protein, putative [Theileria annulata]
MYNFLLLIKCLLIIHLFSKESYCVLAPSPLIIFRNLNKILADFNTNSKPFYLSNLSPYSYRSIVNSLFSCHPNHKLNDIKQFSGDFNHKYSCKLKNSCRFYKFFISLSTHLSLPYYGFVESSHILKNGSSIGKSAHFSLPRLSRSIPHDDLDKDLNKIFEPEEPEIEQDTDSKKTEQMHKEVKKDFSSEIKTYPKKLSRKQFNKEANKIWKKYSHIFKPLETLEEKMERISKLPITKINVDGVEIKVRMGTLGQPWYIDKEEALKLVNTFEPGVLNYIMKHESDKYTRFPLIKEERDRIWIPLPGIQATYFPEIKVLDHRTDIPDYEYVTLLHDTLRNYTWTYQQSTDKRAKSFNGDGKLDTFEIVNDKIVPIEKKTKEPYKRYVPRDYFSIPKNPSKFFARKTLDLGIFRQPKMQDLLNIKYKYLPREPKELELGYIREYQNFWKTVEYRDNKDKPGLRYKQLGKTDLKISEVGLGTMMFGSRVTESEAHELLDYAYDKFGINFFDTCELYPVPFSFETYGNSEKILGNWIKKRGQEVRSNIVVSTRIACNNDNLKIIRNSKDTSLSKCNIIKAVDSSLQRMGLEYIDLLQFSWPERYVPMNENGDYDQVFFDVTKMGNYDNERMKEQVETIGLLIKEGKIKAWGLSNETPWGVLKFTQLSKELGVPPPSTIQLNYNLLTRNELEKGFVELARPQNTGIGIIAYGPLAGGILTGKYLEFVESTTSGRLLKFPSYMKRYRGSLAARAVKEYYDVAMEFKLPNLTVMSLRWVYSRPFIFSTIIGCNDMYQLRENLYCLDPELPITDLMERRINQIYWKWRDPIRIVQ